jgi:phage terminase large subunit-like protein
LTRSERNIKWIEEYCFVPEGKKALIGKTVSLREWQKELLRKIYDNPHGTRQAIISFPRKNGKTALIAFLLLLHLCGPEAVPNSQLYSSAQSRDQAATVFKLASKIVRMSPDLDNVVRIRDTAKELVCPDLGTFYAALSADKSTAHGKSPIFAVHDELGQVAAPTSELYEAVETGMGAHDAPLSIIISTQAPSDNALLSRLIDDALSARDPKTVVTLFSAPLDADPFDVETLKACNPAWGDFLNADEVLRTRDQARAMPSMQPAYFNLHLNLRVEAQAPFVSRTIWQACGGAIEPFGSEVELFGALDLSSVRDLTSFVAIGRVDGLWHVEPHFWLPKDGLIEKSKSDRVSYDLWHKQGYLHAAPGASVDYEYVAGFLRDYTRKHNVKRIAFDRWGMNHFRSWLLRAGFTEEELEAKFIDFGQGFQSMTPALRALESELLNGRVRHASHPVLQMCAANARVQSDPAGNRKLDKMRSTGRIDGMVALAMAFGIAPLEVETVEKSFWETL